MILPYGEVRANFQDAVTPGVSQVAKVGLRVLMEREQQEQKPKDVN